MAGTHNFQVFDATNVNMTSDADYAISPSRLNGVDNGVADPLLANKAWHQATIMAAAIAQYIANQGISTDDTNLSNLVAALAGSIASLSGISYADRTAHGLLGTADIGQISYCAAQPVPATATYTANGTGNLNGNYHYREVLISGYKNADGTYSVRGFSPAASRSTADVSPSSQQVLITNLPVGTAGCIGRAIYRSAAGGSAGSEQFCGIIWDNTTTTYTDNLVDSQLGAGMPMVQGTAIPAAVPTANTTGTTNASSVPVTRKVNGKALSSDIQLATGDITNCVDATRVPTFSGGSGGVEGGEIHLLAAPSSGGYDVALDISTRKFRIFEQGGGANGAYIDMSALSAGVGSRLLTNTDFAAAGATATVRPIVILGKTDSIPTGLADNTVVLRKQS